MSLAIRFRQAFPAITLDFDFEAPTPGTTVLFGPSGGGKTSIVRAVAGLLRPPGAAISLDGAPLQDLPPERRRIGLAFQDARLFPHLSVLGNLRYGQRRVPPGPIGLDQVVDLLGIGHLLDRRPYALSGGERQRVAIGRALLAQPRLLIMDEPLASLDGPRKADILPYLARLKSHLGLPILYVTHAVDEMATLADTIALIDEGRVLAIGPAVEILSRSDLGLAARDDAAAIVEAVIDAHDPRRQLTFLTGGGRSWLAPIDPRPPGSRVRLRIVAREVTIATVAPVGISVHNIIEGRVRGATGDPNRHGVLLEIALDGAALLARVTPDAVERLELKPGASILALVKSVALELLP